MWANLCPVRNWSTVRWARSPWVASLLLIAFFARAMIPDGFMPGAGGFVICNGYMPEPSEGDAATSPASIAGMDMAGMDMSGMDMSSHSNHPTGSGKAPGHGNPGLCPFAAVASAMLVQHQPPLVAALLQPVRTLVDPPPRSFIPRGTIVPTSLPRGPPTLSV